MTPEAEGFNPQLSIKPSMPAGQVGTALADLDPDAILPRLQTRWMGRRYRYEEVTGSTQDVAKEEALAGAPEGTVVLANAQTAGRGRLQRSFITQPGQSLALSVLLRPAPRHLSPLTMVGALAVARAIEDTCGLHPALKWPNDVLLGGRKVAGILLEASSQGAAIGAAILGIGLNVSLRTDAYPEIAATATSLAEQLAPAPAPERAALLVALLQALEDYYEALRRDRPIYDEWRERLETIGRQVRVHVGSTVEDGVAEGVAADGALLLRRADGSLLRLLAGDVTLRE